MTTIGIQNAICDANTVPNPSPNPNICPKAVNIIKNEAPMTTSDETISTLFNVSNVNLNFLFRK